MPPSSLSQPPPIHPNHVQLYTYQKLQQCYHIDCGGNSACLRLQRAPLQQEQWHAELWSRCNVSGEQVKVPLSEWCIITIMCSTNIPVLCRVTSSQWDSSSRMAAGGTPPPPPPPPPPLFLCWLGGQASAMHINFYVECLLTLQFF